jgi:molybdopterin-binding protein
VTAFRFRQVAELLGVSDDTVRRWADSGRLAAITDETGRRAVDGAVLASFVTRRDEEDAEEHASVWGPLSRQSARNRLPGLVTRVVRDTVMAQVELQCGPYRVVSLMSREAADELGLEPGVVAIAGIKSTNVIIEIPEP